MIRIDCHAHANLGGLSYLLPSDVGNHFLHYEELLRIYSEEGINAGILLPLISPEATNNILSNDEVYTITQKDKRFKWCCNVDPRMISNSSSADFSAILKFYKSMGAIGLGELTPNLCLSDPMVENLLFYCAEYELPVTIHWSKSIGEQYGVFGGENMEMLENVLRKFPRLKIIGHSVPFWNLFYMSNENEKKVDALTTLMRKCPNLYCDTSANSGYSAMSLNENRAYVFLNEFSDRILLGLDISNSQDTLYKKILHFYDDAFLNKLITLDAYEKICYKNVLELYSINIEGYL